MMALTVGKIAASTARTIPIFSFSAVIFYRIKTNAGPPFIRESKQLAQAPGKAPSLL
jgi:hypothetical protein